MNKIDRVGAAALTGVLASVMMSTGALAVEWRGWNIHVEGFPNTIAMEQFAAEVTETTEGRVTATVFNGGVLGSQPDAIEQTRNGALDFANFNMGPMGPIVPTTNVLSLPFLFTGEDQMHTVMDGPIGKEFSDSMEEFGLVGLAWFDSGSRSFYNSVRPINEPADVEGLKIRVMNNDLYVDMIGELGGNATPMAFAEVFQSLQTGVIDGAENNYPSFESTNHYEVAGFYSITEHLIIPECICISASSWAELSEEDQELVQAAATRAAITQRELWAARSDASRELVEAAGVEVNEVVDKGAFQAAMAPVYAGFLEKNPSLADLIERIQATK